jgi:hypothetical protein
MTDIISSIFFTLSDASSLVLDVCKIRSAHFSVPDTNIFSSDLKSVMHAHLYLTLNS